MTTMGTIHISRMAVFTCVSARRADWLRAEGRAGVSMIVMA